MPAIKRNVVANVAGKGWSAALALAVVPVYLRILGIEAYGLIGFYLSLSAILALLDLGLGTAINRQLAQYSVSTGDVREMRNLVRTLEIIYWIAGLIIGGVVAVFAPWFADHWLQLDSLPAEVAAETLALMGVAIACQWPRTLYAGGLLGLQKLVTLNGISVAFTTVQNVGAVVVLWRVSPTLQAFMSWHIAIGLLETAVTGAALWRSLPRMPRRAAFDIRLLKRIGRFAAGMAGISATSVVLTQLDKVILSRMLPLEAYGYYTLAWRVAGALYYLVGPITAAFFPRFSQLTALGDERELARLYHRSSQLMSVTLLPLVALLVLFSGELLLLWTGDPATARNSSNLVSLLALGTALNGLMNLPLAVQLAHGATRLVLFTNIAAVAVLGPLIYYMTMHYGGLGAAGVWCLLNAAYFVGLLRLMHRRTMPGELKTWFLVDNAGPALGTFAVALVCKYAIPQPTAAMAMLLYLGLVWVLATVAAVAAAPQMRGLVIHHYSQRTGKALP